MADWNALVGAEGPGKTGTVFHTPSTPTSTSHTPPNRCSGWKHRSLSAGCVYTSTSSNVGATSKSTGGGLGPGQQWWPLCHPLLKKEWRQFSFGTSQPSHPISVKTLWNTLPSVNKALSLLTKSHLCLNEKQFVLFILKVIHTHWMEIQLNPEILLIPSPRKGHQVIGDISNHSKG